MGAWGPGLYSDDFALDLRTTVSAVCRLPIDGSEIVELLCSIEPAALEPSDEDHATFWLVLADQLQRRGIESDARSRALTILQDGSSLQTAAELGMSPADLKQRSRKLAKLKELLAEPPAEKPRRTLARPQPLLFEPGQVYVFPTDSKGNCINPYFTDKERPHFEQSGWGGFLVSNAGHALGYLAWYELGRSRKITRRKPRPPRVVSSIDLRKRGVGTVTRLHIARMQLELLGTVPPPDVPGPPEARTIRSAAADISISNRCRSGPGVVRIDSRRAHRAVGLWEHLVIRIVWRENTEAVTCG